MKYQYVTVNMVLGSVLLFVASTAVAEGCLERVGGLDWGGPAYPRSVAVSDGHAYVASSAGLWIIDVSDPAAPVRVGESEIRTYDPASVDVAVWNGYAYITANLGGLYIVDVSDPTRPVEVSTYETIHTYHASGAAAADGYAYVAASHDGLRIIDVSNPAEPDEVGFYDSRTGEHAFDVVVSDGVAYVATNGGLLILNVSDPTAPVELFRETGHYAYDVAVSDEFAYLTGGRTGLRIIDVSNPSAPTEVAALGMSEYTYGVVAVTDGICYVATDQGLRILDVSNPTEPAEVYLMERGYAITGLAVLDGSAYLAAGGALRIVRVSDPTAPVEVGRYREAPGMASGLVVSGSRAYVSTYSGLWIFNVTDRTRPIEVGHVDTPHDTNNVAVSGNHAYLAADDGLRIIEVSNPAQPVEVAALETPGFPKGVAESHGVAYLATEDGLRIIDVSDPNGPIEVGMHQTPGFAHRVAVSGGFAYVATDGGLLILDVSDTTRPVEVARYETEDFAYDVAVEGSRVFVAAGYGGLLIIDVSEPSKPRQTGHIHLSQYAKRVAVSSGYAYVAVLGRNDLSRLAAVDISNPADPVEICHTGYADNVTVAGGSVFVAEHWLWVYSMSGVTRHWFDIAAHTAGRGDSEWHTDVVALNKGVVDTKFETVLHTADDVLKREHTIPAMNQRVLEDVVGSMGYAGNGALDVQSEQPITVVGSISSRTERGTYGQYLDFPEEDGLLTKGQSVRLLGLREVAGLYRTNISVLNTAVEPAYVQVTLHGNDGAELARYPLEVGPTMVQLDLEPFRVRAGSPDLGWGFATVEVVSGSGVLVSASVVDNRSHDAITVPAAAVTEDPPAPAYAVAASDSHAYVGSGDRMIVLELSPQSSPRVAGHVDLGRTAESITLSDYLAYVAAGEAGLRIIDVSSPGRPLEVGTFDGSGEAHDVAVSEGLAFLADGEGGLRVVDVSTPERPVEVGHYGRLGTRARGVALSGHHVLFVDDIGRLRILDVSTPSDPVLTGILAWWGVTPHAEDVAVEGNHAYVAGCEAGVRIVDVSDLSAPVEVGSIDTPGCATAVVVADGRAYVADHEGGLRIIDVSQPSAPVEVGFHEIEGKTADVWVSNGTVLLAEEYQGLEILRTDGAAVEQVGQYVGSSQPEWTSWLEIASHPPSWLGGEWRTDVVALNESPFDAHVELVLHARGGSLSITNDIRGGHQAVFQDVVGLMGRDGYGALEIRSDRPLAVSGAMTSGGDSGTCGRFLHGHRSPAGLDAGQSAWLPGLRQSSGQYRTNISVTNTGADPAVVAVTLHGADGIELTTYDLEVGAGEVALEVEPFFFRALAPSVGWGFAKIEVASGSGILASASVHDERTGDAITIPMKR